MLSSGCCCTLQWALNLQASVEEQRDSTSSHDETMSRVGKWNLKAHVRAHSLSPCCCFLQQVSRSLGGRNGPCGVTGRIRGRDMIDVRRIILHSSLVLPIIYKETLLSPFHRSVQSESSSVDIPRLPVFVIDRSRATFLGRFLCDINPATSHFDKEVTTSATSYRHQLQYRID